MSAFSRRAAATRLIRHTLPVMAMLCTAGAAHAKLVAPEEREIFRYVDRKTCYIMLTNFPPDPRDVAVKYPPTKKNAVRECEQNLASKRSER